MTGLETFGDLAACARLEELGLYESRPADRRLDVLLECPRLNKLVVGDPYPNDQVAALRNGFRGATLCVCGKDIRGALDDVHVRWRASVDGQLAAL